jgi:hypothetical protein
MSRRWAVDRSVPRRSQGTHIASALDLSDAVTIAPPSDGAEYSPDGRFIAVVLLEEVRLVESATCVVPLYATCQRAVMLSCVRVLVQWPRRVHHRPGCGDGSALFAAGILHHDLASSARRRWRWQCVS